MLLLIGSRGLAQQQPAAADKGAAPSIDPKADAVLKQMGKALSSAKSFTFDVHSYSDDVLPSGQMAQFARNEKISVRRPNHIAATLTGDREDLLFVYTGKQVDVHNKMAKTWSSVDAPDTIDATLDMLAMKYGLALPLADVVLSDPYKILEEHVRSGVDLGVGYVMETRCRHLAFRQDIVDWQIWIEEGAQPVPRKLVITYKDSPVRTQYVAFMSNWNLSADIPDSAFEFKEPAAGETKKVDLTAVQETEADNGIPAPSQSER